jgi:hypothetical protein
MLELQVHRDGMRTHHHIPMGSIRAYPLFYHRTAHSPYVTPTDEGKGAMQAGATMS